MVFGVVCNVSHPAVTAVCQAEELFYFIIFHLALVDFARILGYMYNLTICYTPLLRGHGLILTQ